MLAAKLKHPHASLEIAMRYFHGLEGLEQNYQLGFEYFMQAADHTYLAYRYLGIMYEQGLFIKQDYIHALYYYTQFYKINKPSSYATIIIEQNSFYIETQSLEPMLKSKIQKHWKYDQCFSVAKMCLQWAIFF